jgi:hypothetical protein
MILAIMGDTNGRERIPKVARKKEIVEKSFNAFFRFSWCYARMLRQ